MYTNHSPICFVHNWKSQIPGKRICLKLENKRYFLVGLAHHLCLWLYNKIFKSLSISFGNEPDGWPGPFKIIKYLLPVFRFSVKWTLSVEETTTKGQNVIIIVPLAPALKHSLFWWIIVCSFNWSLWLLLWSVGSLDRTRSTSFGLCASFSSWSPHITVFVGSAITALRNGEQSLPVLETSGLYILV